MDALSPLLVLAHKRPEQLERVLVAVYESSRPRKIYVFCDGPRSPEEELKQEEISRIVDQIPSSFSVRKNFQSENLGLRTAVFSAIDWVFERETAVIVLEDDVLPTKDFFDFCDAGLLRFKFERRIQQVSGYNPLGGFWGALNPRGPHILNSRMDCWGWATWENRWKDFRESQSFPAKEGNQRWVPRALRNEIASGHEAAVRGHLDSWAYSWAHYAIQKNTLSITPRVNLVTNIGFGPDATHTFQGSSALPRRLSLPLHFPVISVPNRGFVVLSIWFANGRRLFLRLKKRLWKGLHRLRGLQARFWALGSRCVRK